MNLLRIVYEWPPPWDGLTPGPFELTRAQGARGYRPRVLCGGWPRHPIEQVSGIAVHRLPSALPRLSLFATTAPAALAAILRWRRWADLIHGHGHLPVWYHNWRRIVRDARPYILHLHVTAAGREAQQRGRVPGFWTRVWEWPLHKFSDRVGCRVADAVICTSQSVREEAIRFYGADPEKLFVVHNGVNADVFSPLGPSSRARFDFKAEDRVMLFVGVLGRRKRPDVLLDVLKVLPKWKLLIVGRGPIAGALRDRAQELGIAERVRFAGYIPYPELPDVYRSADVMVLPSEYEGLPKVVLEALACGVPVVASGFAVKDTVLNRNILWLDKEAGSTEIAEAVSKAVAQPKPDVEDLRTHISWDAQVDKIDTLYQRLLRA